MPRSNPPTLCTALLVWLLLVVSEAAQAQTPLGPEFQVNTITDGDQGGIQSCNYYLRRGQDVASDEAGNMIVVWESEDEETGHARIVGQRLSASGAKKGGEIAINQGDEGDRRTPVVAMDADGNFVVVWNKQDEDGYGMELFGRRFSRDGTPQGLRFRVTKNTEGQYQKVRNPDIETDEDGNFVVIWQRERSDRDIFARLHNADGTPKGDVFQVSASNDNFYWNEMPNVALEESGAFVTVWKTTDGYYGGEAVVGRRFDSSGNPVSSEFQINIPKEYNYFESSPQVASDAKGNFVVVWGSSSLEVTDGGESFGDETDIAARRYDKNGTALDPAELRINTQRDGAQVCPALETLADGRFVVTWNAGYPSDTGQGYGRLLDDAGLPLGDQFLLGPEDPTRTNQGTALAPIGRDFAVVSAGDAHDEDGFDVFGRLYSTAKEPPPICPMTPRSDCHSPATGRSKLDLRVDSNPERNRLKWQWDLRNAGDAGQIGEPTDDTGYSLCIYDSDPAGQQPILTAQVKGGEMCGRRECWRQTQSLAGALRTRFYDPDVNADGIRRLRFKVRGESRVKIKLGGRGENLTTPDFPLVLPVRAQLLSGNGRCWTSDFDAARRNEPGSFRARSSGG